MKTDNTQCLNEVELATYIEGTISPESREAVENHFGTCGQCWDEFIGMNRVISAVRDAADMAVPEHLVRKAAAMFPEKNGVLDVVLKKLRDSLDVLYRAHDMTLFTPLPASGLRSGKMARPEMVVIKKSFQDIDLQLDVEKVSETICNIRVAVDSVREKGLLKGLRAELIADGRVLESEPLESGELVLEDINSGRYTIKILRKGETLGQISLQLE